METLNVVFVADKNYYAPTATVILNILNNENREVFFDFYLIDVNSNGAEEFIAYFQDLGIEKKYINFKMHCIPFDVTLLDSLETRVHISSAAYAKAYINRILNIDKAIYLDSDIVIIDSLSNLWGLFNSDYMIQAVENPGYNYDNPYLGIDENDKTFNSGVMLLNLKKMRDNNVHEELIKFIQENHNKTKLHDQAAYNAIFARNWGKLPLRWNIQRIMFISTYKQLDVSKQDMCSLLDNPGIVHFTSRIKPWMFRCSQPYADVFIRYYELLFGNIVYQDKGFADLWYRFRTSLIYQWYKFINKWR